jgi:multiple sugar transport system substrate-binding protein/raffinose/stachyose/melibiose transport system substrate-binding protein
MKGKGIWRRVGAVAVVAGAASMVLAGCSSNGSNGSGDGAKTTSAHLRVIVNISPNLTVASWNALFDKYEKKHPGVTVALERTGTISASDKLNQDLAAGDPPDLVQQVQPSADTAKLFTDLSKQSWVNGTPLVDNYKINGKVYVVGAGQQVQSLVFYNKAAFKKAGLDASAIHTVSQLTDAMGKLKDAGYVPLQTAGQWVTGGQFTMFNDSTTMTKTSDWIAKRKAGDVSFTGDKDYMSSLKAYKSWVDKGYLQKSDLGLAYADGQTNFLEGKSAMYMMGSFFVPAADQAKKSDDIGVFSMPTTAKYPTKQYSNLADPYVVVKQSKNQKAAIDLAKWLTTDKTAVAAQLAADGNFRKGYTYDMSSLGKAVQKIINDAPGGFVEAAAQQPLTGYSTELNSQIQSLYSGSTPQQVAENLDKWWDSQAQ